MSILNLGDEHVFVYDLTVEELSHDADAIERIVYDWLEEAQEIVLDGKKEAYVVIRIKMQSPDAEPTGDPI